MISVTRYLLITAILALMPLCLHAEVQLDAMRKAYMKEVSDTEKLFQQDIRELPGKYKATLKKLEASYIQKGDLDNVIILRKELERIEGMKDYPDAPGEGLSQSLRNIWEKGAGYIDRRRRERDAKIDQINKQYSAQLENMMRELTKAQKFEDALAVRKELKDFESGSYKNLKETDSEPKKPEPVDIRKQDGFRKDPPAPPKHNPPVHSQPKDSFDQQPKREVVDENESPFD
jgi:hypothetical protein